MMMVESSNIKKYFPIERGYLKEVQGVVKAVDGVSISIERNTSYGLVGESGCGKTTLGKIILGILKPDSGSLKVHSGRLQAIFQDPYNSLDPKMKACDIISESLVLRKEYDNIRRKVEDVVDLVRLPKASIYKYPHQFSGGERQRIAIARAILSRPEFMVCDEPVSSLDVTIELEILKLLKEIRERFSVTYLFISHDLRVVRFMCEKLSVMQGGKIVEEGPVQKIYSNPTHPYTKTLMASIIDIYAKVKEGR